MGGKNGLEIKVMSQVEAVQFAKKKGVEMSGFSGGITLIDLGGRATVIIDKDLDLGLRVVYTAHELAQLNKIREAEAEGYPFSSICSHAHQVGLRAGVEEAKKRGVLDQYLQHRGVKSVEELR